MNIIAYRITDEGEVLLDIQIDSCGCEIIVKLADDHSTAKLAEHIAQM